MGVDFGLARGGVCAFVCVCLCWVLVGFAFGFEFCGDTVSVVLVCLSCALGFAF